MRAIPYGKQDISVEDINAVKKVLEADWITQGPEVDEFEAAVADYTGARYAVAVSNGTAALHLACLAAGLGPGDEAITTPVTFLSTPNSVLYTGADPVFCDIEAETRNMDLALLPGQITGRTRAFLPVHFAGLPCDMAAISRIAAEKDIKIIEDACHALGARYQAEGQWFRVGSCAHSDMTVFSFHPVKHITTGEGGIITTNSSDIYESLVSLRSHGMVKTPDMKDKKGPWYYEMRSLGYNYRITDFQCALGISQLSRLDDFLEHRQAIARTYDRAFSGIENISVLRPPADKEHAYHLYVLEIDYHGTGITRKDFVEQLKMRGILTQVHYIPVYRQPYYRQKYHFRAEDYPVSERYYERAVSIPMYPGMSDKDIKKVISAIKNTLRGN
jgi:UDP-4-amino-4,6-dideoxy-N-acetyl-beta-L-altrosamine transaminase